MLLVCLLCYIVSSLRGDFSALLISVTAHQEQCLTLSRNQEIFVEWIREEQPSPCRRLYTHVKIIVQVFESRESIFYILFKVFRSIFILYTSHDLTAPRDLTNACGINIMKVKLMITVRSNIVATMQYIRIFILEEGRAGWSQPWVQVSILPIPKQVQAT